MATNLSRSKTGLFTDDKAIHARRAKRVDRAREGLGNAENAIGPIKKNMALFCITRGQISMIDVISHCIFDVGLAARLSCWVWAIANWEIEAFDYFFREDLIDQALLVLDRSGERRRPDLVQKWIDQFGPGSIKIAQNHAKMATIETKKFRLAIRGSMNLNFNPRFEQFDLSEGDEVFNLIRQIESEMPASSIPSTRQEANAATGLSKHYTDDTLQRFQGPKTWQP